METVNNLQRVYETALRHEEKRIDGNLGQKDERYAQAKQNGPYILSHGITITMDDRSQAVSGNDETVSSTILGVDLVDLFRKDMMHSVIALVQDVAKEAEQNVPDCELRLIFLKSEYMLVSYILTFIYVDLEKDV